MARTVKENLLGAQRNEITEHHVYRRLSEATTDRGNARVLEHLSNDELLHYQLWRSQTRQEVQPSRFRVWWYVLLSRLFGLTFGMRLMESGEAKAKLAYADLGRSLPAAARVAHDEDAHERELIGMIDEERLRYVGSIVLGLNDALVELTGTLAGLTFALQNARLIAMAGLITGVAASLSMAASEYLSTKSEERGQSPLKASLYTGSTYALASRCSSFPTC